MNKKRLLLGLLSLAVILNPSYALAEEMSITGNGDGSTSSINVGSSSNTNVEQNNTAQVTNNVEVNANTGGNSASENSNGDTSITTGDITSNVDIVNAGINQSEVSVGCCENSDSNITISGNGSGSNNSVNYQVNSGRESANTSVTVNNTANIVNSINGRANTGYNTANENNGNVSIKTGGIYVEDTIINRSINISSVEAGAGNGGSVNIKISGNGADSENAVIVENNSAIRIAVNNEANITNESNWDLNTGLNEANKNNGDVEIETGDIVYKVTIENTDINTSIVDVDCCGDDDHTTPPDGTPTPSNPTPNNPSQGGTSGGGSGSTGGTTTSQPILPVTGSVSLLVLAIVTTIMFSLGWYLRLRSGRSPNLAI